MAWPCVLQARPSPAPSLCPSFHPCCQRTLLPSCGKVPSSGRCWGGDRCWSGSDFTLRQETLSMTPVVQRKKEFSYYYFFFYKDFFFL